MCVFENNQYWHIDKKDLKFQIVTTIWCDMNSSSIYIFV